MAATDYMADPVNAARGTGGAAPLSAAGTEKLPLPVILYVLAVVIPIGFNLGPLAMTSLRLFLIIMVVPLMVNVFTGKYGKVFLTDYLFVLHILWAAVAIFVNNPSQMVQQVGSVGMEFLGGYAVGRAYIRSPGAFMSLCRLLILAVCCLMPFALHETLTGRPIIVEAIRKLPSITSVPIISIERRLGLERVQGSFAHPIHFGLFCSVAFSLSFVALRGTVSEARRYLMSILIAATGFLALSSGALTAIFIQVALILWAAMFASVKQRWWILVALFALAYVVVDLLSNRSPIKVFMSYATFSAHNAYWRAIIFEWGVANVLGSVEKGITGSPIFGIGLNDWIRPHFMNSGSMDNFWLVMAVRYGVPGLVLLAVGYIYAIARIMRRNFEGNERLTLIRRAWVFTFLGLSFTLCTVHVWTNIYSFTFFMFGAGIWLIMIDPEPDADSTDPAQTPTAGPGAAGGRRPMPAFSRPVPPIAPKTPGPVMTRAHSASATSPPDRSQPKYSRFPSSSSGSGHKH